MTLPDAVAAESCPVSVRLDMCWRATVVVGNIRTGFCARRVDPTSIGLCPQHLAEMRANA